MKPQFKPRYVHPKVYSLSTTWAQIALSNVFHICEGPKYKTALPLGSNDNSNHRLDAFCVPDTVLGPLSTFLH